MEFVRKFNKIRMDQMSYHSAIKNHVAEPINYPKVQGPMENKCQVIFANQINFMVLELTKEMVEIKK